MIEDYHYERAWQCYRLGQHAQAIELLKSLLGQSPNEAMYHGLLAACLLSEKRLHAAAYEIGIALQLEPQRPFLLLTMGRILLFKNKPEAALEKCQEALALEPENIDALVLQSELYQLQNNNKAALQSLEQALSLAPQSAEILTELGDYYYSNNQLAKAATFTLDALQQDPGYPDAHIVMGHICLKQGNIEEARYHASYAISENPESERALALFSHIKMRKNPFMGVWWRINSWLANMSPIKSAAVLISGYLVFSLLSQILEDTGYPTASSVTSYAWLGLVIYSWIGLPIYYRMLEKELNQFQFNNNF